MHICDELDEVTIIVDLAIPTNHNERDQGLARSLMRDCPEKRGRKEFFQEYPLILREVAAMGIRLSHASQIARSAKGSVTRR